MFRMAGVPCTCMQHACVLLLRHFTCRMQPLRQV